MQLLYAIAIIKNFFENECDELYTAAIRVKKDGTILRTDWGYFWDGLREIEEWAKKDMDGGNA